VFFAHSIYFQVLGEQGFVGLFLFLLLGLLAWRTGSKVINAAKDVPENKWAADLAAMGQVSLIGYATAGAFLGLAYFDLPYHLVVIIVLTKVLLIKDGVTLKPRRISGKFIRERPKHEVQTSRS
jgi:putative inorganic carbon (HCO3(-)) transporter